MKKFALAFILIATSSFVAANDRWKHIQDSLDGTTSFYLDVGTVRLASSYIRAWQLINYKEQHEVGPNKLRYFSSAELHEYDCQERRSRTVSVAAYPESMGGGNPVFSAEPRDPKWRFIVPNSISETFFSIFCNK